MGKNKKSKLLKNSVAADQGRSVYVRGIPPDWEQRDLEEIFRLHGGIETVNLLPARQDGFPFLTAIVNFFKADEAAAAALACDDSPVITASSTGDFRIRCTHKRAEAKVPGASMLQHYKNLPQPKRKHEEWVHANLTPIEVHGFPEEATSAEIHELFQTSGKEIHAVKLLRHESNEQIMALLYLSSMEDARDIIGVTDGLAFAPGWCLHARLKSADAPPGYFEEEQDIMGLDDTLQDAPLTPDGENGELFMQEAPLTPPDGENEESLLQEAPMTPPHDESEPAPPKSLPAHARQARQPQVPPPRFAATGKGAAGGPRPPARPPSGWEAPWPSAMPGQQQRRRAAQY